MDSENIEFPVTLTIKIIALDDPDLEARLISFLAKEGIANPLLEGNHSRKGTYVTYNVETTCETLEEMRAIYENIAEVEGVKMVL